MLRYGGVRDRADSRAGEVKLRYWENWMARKAELLAVSVRTDVRTERTISCLNIGKQPSANGNVQQVTGEKSNRHSLPTE